MGKKTRKRRKLSLKKQSPRSLRNIDEKEMEQVSGGTELLYKSYESTTTLETDLTISGTIECDIFIRNTWWCTKGTL